MANKFFDGHGIRDEEQDRVLLVAWTVGADCGDKGFHVDGAGPQRHERQHRAVFLIRYVFWHRDVRGNVKILDICPDDLARCRIEQTGDPIGAGQRAAQAGESHVYRRVEAGVVAAFCSCGGKRHYL